MMMTMKAIKMQNDEDNRLQELQELQKPKKYTVIPFHRLQIGNIYWRVNHWAQILYIDDTPLRPGGATYAVFYQQIAGSDILFNENGYFYKDINQNKILGSLHNKYLIAIRYHFADLWYASTRRERKILAQYFKDYSTPQIKTELYNAINRTNLRRPYTHS